MRAIATRSAGGWGEGAHFVIPELTRSPSIVIAREGGRSSIPEAPVMEPRSRSVLDTPHARGMTTVVWASSHPCTIAFSIMQ